MIWKRVECHGDNACLTSWQHPGTKILQWSNCKSKCGW
jgi:hypothetical protein